MKRGANGGASTGPRLSRAPTPAVENALVRMRAANALVWRANALRGRIAALMAQSATPGRVECVKSMVAVLRRIEQRITPERT